MKAIQKELGENDEDADDDINELEKKIEETKLSKEARKSKTELKKLNK